jgi:hypothetical protein
LKDAIYAMFSVKNIVLPGKVTKEFSQKREKVVDRESEVVVSLKGSPKKGRSKFQEIGCCVRGENGKTNPQSLVL